MREIIIEKNCKLLYAYMPAYLNQIKKAVNRGDVVSVNHRTSAFMESYFDVIFALNEQTHPGEKRLVAFAKGRCNYLPDNFEENINKLYSNLFVEPDKAVMILEDMIEKLKMLLQVLYVR